MKSPFFRPAVIVVFGIVVAAITSVVQDAFGLGAEAAFWLLMGIAAVGSFWLVPVLRGPRPPRDDERR
jgi:4-amino-4-deoxy-L-arabinose transferase-like glycosyltransferase